MGGGCVSVRQSIASILSLGTRAIQISIFILYFINNQNLAPLHTHTRIDLRWVGVAAKTRYSPASPNTRRSHMSTREISPPYQLTIRWRVRGADEVLDAPTAQVA